MTKVRRLIAGSYEADHAFRAVKLFNVTISLSETADSVQFCSVELALTFSCRLLEIISACSLEFPGLWWTSLSNGSNFSNQWYSPRGFWKSAIKEALDDQSP